MLTVAQVLIGSVWIFHGFYSKLLRGIPRHRAIIARVLGEQRADRATTLIGVSEILPGAIGETMTAPINASSAAAAVAVNIRQLNRTMLSIPSK